MRPLAEATVRAGLVDEDTLAQFRRWGFIPKDLAADQGKSPQESLECIQAALDAEEQVRLQVTDLDLLRYYMEGDNQIRGQIVLVDVSTGQRGTKNVTFAKRASHGREQFILPWLSEGVTELLVNGDSYLRWAQDGVSHRVRFIDYEDLYFGDVRMFIVCTGVEDNGNSAE